MNVIRIIEPLNTVEVVSDFEIQKMDEKNVLIYSSQGMEKKIAMIWDVFSDHIDITGLPIFERDIVLFVYEGKYHRGFVHVDQDSECSFVTYKDGVCFVEDCMSIRVVGNSIENVDMAKEVRAGIMSAQGVLREQNEIRIERTWWNNTKIQNDNM